jgi:hypothetical protein
MLNSLKTRIKQSVDTLIEKLDVSPTHIDHHDLNEEYGEDYKKILNRELK